MARADGVLLTGATGFLGRHLLRELLRNGRPVAVLARDPNADRTRDAVDTAVRNSGRPPSQVTVLGGDVRKPLLGLALSDRYWLGRNAGALVHAAACTSFRANETASVSVNVDGTRHAIDLCRAVGLSEAHHVSTAFVCGLRPGPILETDLDRGQRFRTAYERTKFDAERLFRASPSVRATVYRPSVITGDSRDGSTTSYDGFYHLLEAAARSGGEVRGRLRLPFDGSETKDLVPVDWVARAIARISARPECHGRTYHLTATAPVTIREIAVVADRELKLGGVEFVGTPSGSSTTRRGRAYLAGVRDYRPYFGGDPVFDRRNTAAALPGDDAPRIDAAALARLMRFAVADGWGRAPGFASVDCARYIERFFPARIARSSLADFPVAVALGFDVRGPAGGRWVCRMGGGRVVSVHGGTLDGADVTYRTDSDTFAAVVSGTDSPSAAFFARRITIEGRVETGLMLATLFEGFVREHPFRPNAEEGRRAVAG